MSFVKCNDYYLFLYFLILVPSQAPVDFTVAASSSTSILASWLLPPEKFRNGIITGFKLFYKEKGKMGATETINGGASRIRNVTGLKKSKEYEFQVLAFTSVGDGPKSSVKTVRTIVDGKTLGSHFVAVAL